MKTVFADAGYWIAILNPADDLHVKAVSVSNALNPFGIVTSEMIFTEVLNSFSKRESVFKQALVQFVKQSFDNPKIEVVTQTNDLFYQSLDLYEQRADKAWSHTDCASFCMWMVDLFERKHLASDFSLYLHRPTATDPTLAPPGCDCWYVLAPVPNLDGATDWKEMAKPYRDAIIQYLEQHYLPNLSSHIVTEHHIDPLHFRDELNSYKGTAFSVEPTLFQSAWFRPHNISEDIPNLYCVGAGTHPGAGLPGVMSSGKIVAQMIGQADN